MGMKIKDAIFACSLLANVALGVYALTQAQKPSSTLRNSEAQSSSSTQERHVSALDREAKSEDTATAAASLSAGQREKQVVTLPRSALRYLHFEGLSEKGSLTPTFDDVASITKAEHAEFQKLADAVLSQLRQEREASSRIRNDNNSSAVIDVLPYGNALNGILGEAAEHARNLADPEAAEVFVSVLRNEAEQRFNSSGERSGTYEITPFTGRDGSRYYRVTVSESSPESAQVAARYINEYSREQLLRNVPLAARLSLVQ